MDNNTIPKQEAWQMTREEFISSPHTVTDTTRSLSFDQWAKTKGVEVPKVDMGKVIGMTMINNRTARESGQWKSELIKKAKYDVLYKQYLTEVPEGVTKVPANELQAGMLHKRQIRLALSEGKPVPLEVLKDYPELVKQVPKAETGEPEAGLQPSMLEEVADREVRPSGRGKVTQLSMDEQLKLETIKERSI